MTISRAKANPTKSFFVRMLTRDISLDDCILDLIDNSVDSAWSQTEHGRSELSFEPHLSAYTVEIEVQHDRFTIKDNCGGITLDQAANEAFTFGRVEGALSDDYSVGVYGIGMKRAIFKIGSQILIRSTFANPGSKALSSFQVPISVESWVSNDTDGWDFDIEESGQLEAAGVHIEIDDLSNETSDKFGDPTYENSLRKILGRDYMMALMHGLNLTVNGTAVVGQTISLRQGEDFAPLRENYEDDQVTVEIVAGMQFTPPEDVGPDESAADRLSGWYVFCNGRAVLAGDTSSVTGWGTTLLPKWHNQYSGFAGLVFFSALNAVSLPMTTTKRSVDVSSPVYRRALPRMAKPARAWIDYTNARKLDIETSRAQEAKALAVDLPSVTPSSHVSLPQPPRVVRTRVANVNYARPLVELRQLAHGFGDVNLTYRDVGIQSFEFAYKMLVDEDES